MQEQTSLFNLDDFSSTIEQPNILDYLPPLPKGKGRWNEESRRRQSMKLKLKEWEPWDKIKGSKSEHGKKMSSLNSVKHGMYSRKCRTKEDAEWTALVFERALKDAQDWDRELIRHEVLKRLNMKVMPQQT